MTLSRTPEIDYRLHRPVARSRPVRESKLGPEHLDRRLAVVPRIVWQVHRGVGFRNEAGAK
jgi:hypothetical protein